jgi:hypothetical protein
VIAASDAKGDSCEKETEYIFEFNSGKSKSHKRKISGIVLYISHIP